MVKAHCDCGAIRMETPNRFAINLRMFPLENSADVRARHSGGVSTWRYLDD